MEPLLIERLLTHETPSFYTVLPSPYQGSRQDFIINKGYDMNFHAGINITE